jgi:hypothetical protein
VSSVAEKIPLFGGAISAVTTTLTGLVGVALGFADKLADTNRSLYETGVVLEDLGVQTGGGIDEFVQIAGELGISGGTITKAMELAGESFAKMGGGGAGGSMRPRGIEGGNGGSGAVRIIWSGNSGLTRAFPNINADRI